jgi:ribosome-associated protein
MGRRSRRKGQDTEPDFAAPAGGPAHVSLLDDDDAPQDAAPSRTRRKQESELLQKLGGALLTLRAEPLAALDLPEQLRDALAEAKRLPSFGAQRRQLQFIGKLMRKLDPERLRAVVAAVEDRLPGHLTATRRPSQATRS